MTTIIACAHNNWPMLCRTCKPVNWGTLELAEEEAFRKGFEAGKQEAQRVVYEMMRGSPDARNIEAAIGRLRPAK